MIRRIARLLALSAVLWWAPSSASEEIEGIWVLDRLMSNAEPGLTNEGAALQQAYNLLVDDPSLYCVPASLGRVYANPNSRFEIRYSDAQLQMGFELFDLRRTVEFSNRSVGTEQPSTTNLDGQSFPEMGVSRAEWSDRDLLIHSNRYAPGYIRTSSGLPQGANTHSIERFYRDGAYLMLDLTYSDEQLFEQPFTIVHRFVSAELDELPVYNCQDASYDWFEQLNNPPMISN